ncbi:hypothetical protein ACQKEY_19805 [Lysinibacillus fusiformis]|uniref:hypothetical protein n=1 Tax=Lysinibacillus fusiformis TaxID=28031 RepID=UPI003CFBFA4D
MLTIQYYSQEEREQLIVKHSNKFLIEERNITEGNFLVFSDTPNTNVLPVVVTKDEFDELKTSIADLWETVLMGGNA